MSKKRHKHKCKWIKLDGQHDKMSGAGGCICDCGARWYAGQVNRWIVE